MTTILHLTLFIRTDKFFFAWNGFILPMFTLDEALHICNANHAPIYDYRRKYTDDMEDEP